MASKAGRRVPLRHQFRRVFFKHHLQLRIGFVTDSCTRRSSERLHPSLGDRTQALLDFCENPRGLGFEWAGKVLRPGWEEVHAQY